MKQGFVPKAKLSVMLAAALWMAACASRPDGPASNPVAPPDRAAAQANFGADSRADTPADTRADTRSDPRADPRADPQGDAHAHLPTESPADSPSHPPAHYLLLGEVHDNPSHHQARAERLKRLLADRPGAVVVMEQMARTQDAALAQSLRDHPGDVELLLEAGQFDRKGWRWPLHQPVLEAAVRGGAALRGGNLERDQVRRIVREGDAAWPQDLLSLRARTSWTDDQQQTLVRDIQDGHCGALPASMVPGMVNAQRARDAAMAQAMLQARQAGAPLVVLIAGNGHVRRDVAVPVYLQAAGVPASDIEVVGYLETGSAAPDGLYDVSERAPAPAREDPCAVFKR